MYVDGWDPSKDAKEADRNVYQATFNNLPVVLAGQLRKSQLLEDDECDAHVQEGQKVGFRELQTCQSDLDVHLQDDQVIKPSQHEFMKGKSLLTNLISFYDMMTHLVNVGKTVYFICLDVSKVFAILLEKLSSHDRSTVQ